MMVSGPGVQSHSQSVLRSRDDAQVESSRVVDRRRRTLIEESARLHKQGTIIRSFLNGTGRIGRERERESWEKLPSSAIWMEEGGRVYVECETKTRWLPSPSGHRL